MLLIAALARSGQESAAPAAVGAYIGAAYWWTSSTSFANPAVTVGRMFSDTFAGIAPGSARGFITAQLAGGLLAVAAAAWWYPASRSGAADIVVPHEADRADADDHARQTAPGGDDRRARRAGSRRLPARHRHRQRHLRDRPAHLGSVHRRPGCPSTVSSPSTPASGCSAGSPAAAVSDRCVYAGVVEHSVYVHPGRHGGQGVGRALLEALIAVHRAGRDLDDPVRDLPREHRQPRPARRLRLPHRRHPRRVGKHHGTWRDVLLIERRSPTIT